MSARAAATAPKISAKTSPKLAKTQPKSHPPADSPEPSPLPPPTSQKIPVQFDWKKWYLSDEEDMGAGPTEDFVADTLRQILTTVCNERGLDPFCIGRDIFFAWVKEHPLVRVSPDVHFSDTPIFTHRKSVQTWRPGEIPPRWAVEVVSTTWRKDYQSNPQKYDQLGVEELVIFDPEVFEMSERRRKKSGRVPLQLYRRDGSGHLLLVYQGELGPVWCESIGLGVVVAEHPVRGKHVRLTRDREGRVWVPTPPERLEDELRARTVAEQKAREERAAREHAEQKAREEHAAREHAEQKAREEHAARGHAEQKTHAQEQAIHALEERLRALQAELQEARDLSKNKP